MTDALTYHEESVSLIVQPAAVDLHYAIVVRRLLAGESRSISDLTPTTPFSYHVPLGDIPLDDTSVLRSRMDHSMVITQESGGYAGKIPGTDIEDWAATYDEIVRALRDMVFILWTEYALEADDLLAEDAILLKRQVLRQFHVITK